MKRHTFTRRDLLRFGLLTGGATLISGGPRLSRAESGSSASTLSGSSDIPTSPKTTPFLEAMPVPPRVTPVAPFTPKADPTGCINLDGTTAVHLSGPRPVTASTQYLSLTVEPAPHSFHPQLPPNVVWGYNGMAPGPTIVSRSGTPHLVRFKNKLPQNDPVGIGEPIVAIHRHGGFQKPEDDGYPLDTFCYGQTRDYAYPNRPDQGLAQNEHSTLWYHDHAIDITAENVYRGLAGFYLNFDEIDSDNERDPNPRALRLPSGAYDVPVVIQDKRFDENGFLFYDSFDHDGFIGDKIVVNGKIQPYFKVAKRKYRFRFLNGSNARQYELVLSNGQPFVVIATDSNLLERPLTVTSFRIAPAERVEAVIDFSSLPIGTQVYLVNRLEQDDGRKPDGLVSPGVPIVKFIVDRYAADYSQVPAILRPIVRGPRELLPQVRIKRSFEFDRSHGAWTINGEFFDENRVNAKPKVNSVEIWELSASGGWEHPIHLHLSEFFVLARNGSTPPPLERGRKDTVVIGGDRGDVTILAQFPEFLGRFVFHCHTIEHEDMRMMGQFEVQP